MSVFFDPENIDALKELGKQTGQDLLGNIVKLNIDTTPPMIEEMENLVQSENYEQAGRVAHKLKSSCANLGLVALKESCQSVEAKSETSPIDKGELQKIVSEIKEMYQKSLSVFTENDIKAAS